MDSVTQAALGAAVGEAVGGRALGRRALVWGAVAGTLPDLDVAADLFLSAPAALYAHRGLTHSLFFAPVVAPLLAQLFVRWYWRRGRRDALARWKPWAAVWFAALWTHPLLDLFTNWGTQLLWPFSDHPFALSSVFIIDPAYTLPLLIGIGGAALQRRAPARRRAVALALIVSTLYLGWSLGAQAHARQVFRAALDRQGIAHVRLLVQPTPLNTILWGGLAETPGGYVHGLYGLLDDDPHVAFQTIPRRAAPLEALAETEPVRVLRWFSRGWLTTEQHDGALYAADLRFALGALAEGPLPYAFAFRLFEEDGRWTFRQEATGLDFGTVLRRTACRALSRPCGDGVDGPAAVTSGAVR